MSDFQESDDNSEFSLDSSESQDLSIEESIQETTIQEEEEEPKKKVKKREILVQKQFKSIKVIVENEAIQENTRIENISSQNVQSDQNVETDQMSNARNVFEKMEKNEEIVQKVLDEWVEKHGNYSRDLKVLLIGRNSQCFDCVFENCKSFKNYNGLLYHLEKYAHSFSQIGITKEFMGVHVARLNVKFHEKKKVYQLQVLFQNDEIKHDKIKQDKIEKVRNEVFGKVDLQIYPGKENILEFKRRKLGITWFKNCQVLNRDEMKVFLPEPEDLRIKIEKVYSLKLFKGVSPDSSNIKEKKRQRNRWILNTGISVAALDYCPLKDYSARQYLAVGGNKNKHENQVMGQVQFEDFPQDPRMAQMIQIWELDGRNAPKMVLGLAHRYGCVFDLKWCPFDSSTVGDDETVGQLGFLAASFGDGSCRVFSVPNPNSLKKYYPEYSNDEMIIASCESRFEVALPGTQLWKLDWVGPCTLVNGTTDGRVVVWNVGPFLTQQLSKEPEPMSIYFAHDCAVRKVEGCLKSDYYFITSGNDGRFLLHDIRQPFPNGQLLRSVSLMTGICWSGSRVIGSDRENNVRLCQPEEGSSINENTVGDVFAQLKTVGVMRHHSTVWDCDGSPYSPFVASSSSSLTIANINRSKRHHSPVVLFLYSLAYDNVENILEFHDQEGIPEKPISKISTTWQFSQPETSIYKISWNKNNGHEYEIASGGRLGYIRLESCLKQ